MKCGNMEVNIFNKNLVFIKLLISIVCLFAGILVIGSLWLFLSSTSEGPGTKEESKESKLNSMIFSRRGNSPDENSLDTETTELDYDVLPLEKSVRNFAADIYKEMSHEPGNIIFSPSSLHICTAMVQLAAEGRTLHDMASTLHLPQDRNEVRRIYKEATEKIRSTQKNILTSANKVFVKNDFDISDKFALMAKDAFDAGLESKDFSDRVKAASDINDWIKKQTHDKITDIITPDVIEDLTKLILINTLYFKGEWINPFDSELTRARPFNVNSTTQVQTEIMYTTGEFMYYEDKEMKAKYVELPYLDNEFTMMIILPSEVEGLANLENRLHDVLNFDPKKLRLTEALTVLIPKFKIEKTSQLNTILMKLGMESAFVNDELTGFSKTKYGLHISTVLQKTFIDVNEKGTEAGAVTADILSDRMLGTYFNANHPFLFVLKQQNNGLIHFIGRYVGPSKTT